MEHFSIDGAAAWLLERSEDLSSISSSTLLYEAATNATAAQLLITELKFAAAKSIRTSTIILASFNAVAAFTTACGILYDGYSTRKQSQLYRPRSTPTPLIEATEIYPLVLSCGITIQAVVFALAQAQGLNSLVTTGCTLVSQIMFPALFIVPYIQLVFGAEIVGRSLFRNPFPRRGKYATLVCIVLVVLLLLANFLVAHFVPSPNRCYASLFWFVGTYAEGSFIVLLAINAFLVLGTILLFVRLSRSSKTDAPERVAASRMVYYMALAVVSNTFLMPFFFLLGLTHKDKYSNEVVTFSMVASVVANVSGLMTGGLHLFLRSKNGAPAAPYDKAADFDRHRMKSQIRRYDNPSDPNFASHMMGPVSGAEDLWHIQNNTSPIGGNSQKMDHVPEESSSNGNHQHNLAVSSTYPESLIIPVSPMPPAHVNPLRSNAVFADLPTVSSPKLSNAVYSDPTTASRAVPLPTAVSRRQSPSPPATPVSPSPIIIRPPSSARKLSLMPDTSKPLLLLPATTYTPGPLKTKNMAAKANNKTAAAKNMSINSFNPPEIHLDINSLMPPPSMNNLMIGRHRRDSSMVSSATVQIGLRLSNVDDFVPINSQLFDKKVYTLEYPPAEEFLARDLERQNAASVASASAAAAAVAAAEAAAAEAAAKSAAASAEIEAAAEALKSATLIAAKVEPLSTFHVQQSMPSSPSQSQNLTRAANIGLARSPSPDSGYEERSVYGHDNDDEAEGRRSPENGNVRVPATLPPMKRGVLALQTQQLQGSAPSASPKSSPFYLPSPTSPSGYSLQSPTAATANKAVTAALLQTKLPSPRGVGFAIPLSRSNSSTTLKSARHLPAGSSGDSNSNSTKTRGDWI